MKTLTFEEALKADKLTYKDFTKFPDFNGLINLLEGKLTMTPAPIIKHQKISWNLNTCIGNFVLKNDLGFVFYAPTDVVLSQEVVVEPDIFFIFKTNKKIIGSKNIQGSPNLIIEIISPTSFLTDTKTKKTIYQKFGVQEYWIVYPNEEIIEIFTLENQNYEVFGVFTIEDVLSSKVLKGLEIKLKEVFRED